VDLKALSHVLGVSKLGFASPERLHRYLGVEPGAVSILGLINDVDGDGDVEVIVDEAVWRAAALRCHPLVNTSTLAIPQEGIQRFLEITGHPARVLNVPDRM
jgi:Ala-tRNA(Pro) deacylase